MRVLEIGDRVQVTHVDPQIRGGEDYAALKELVGEELEVTAVVTDDRGGDWFEVDYEGVTCQFKQYELRLLSLAPQ